MWSISEVKQTGKDAFKTTYWGCVLASLILSVLAAGSTWSSTSQSLSKAVDSMEQAGLNTEQIAAVAALAGGTAMFFSLIWIVLRIVLLNPLEVGCHVYLKDNILGDVSFDKLKVGYDSWKKTVITLFLRDLFMAIGFMILFFPGVILGYGFMLVPYLIEDEPELSFMDTLKRSLTMMKGYKMKAFLMDLSFIGWMILSFLTCGIVGLLYEQPYRLSSKAAFYLKLREAETPAQNVVNSFPTDGPAAQ